MFPRIILAPRVAVTLEAIRNKVNNLEFSGFGFCTRNNMGLYVYDFVLLDVGNFGYTEISTENIVSLMQRKDASNMKVWIHRHPIGNGKPGKHNWSSVDENTIQTCPLGGIPGLVKWSASIVITPKGWVGRIDNHLTRQTLHVSVFPRIKWSQVLKAEELYIQHHNSTLSNFDKEDDDDLWLGDGYSMSADEIEKYLDDLDECDWLMTDDSDEDETEQDFLLSNMHVAAIHSAKNIIR